MNKNNEIFEERVMIFDTKQTPVTSIPIHKAASPRETKPWRPLESNRPWERPYLA